LLGNFQVKRAPFKGAKHTVEVIIKAALDSQAHFCVRQLGEEIVKDLRTKDYLSEALAVYHYVCRKTKYQRDPRTVELVKAPYLVCQDLIQGGRPALDCDDITALLAALLLSLGAQCRVVTVAFANQFYNGERQYSHVFVQVFEPKSRAWVTLDPVAGSNTKKMMRRAVASKVYPVA
jgi:transglutaminase-like putative cysteine protease